jgi:hypothetical protein
MSAEEGRGPQFISGCDRLARIRAGSKLMTAYELGHNMKWDPGRLARWTCSVCGRAVINCDGNVYGSALTNPCNGVTGNA